MQLWTEDDPPGGEPETIKNNFEPNPEQFFVNFGDLLRGDDGIFANRVHISQHPSRFIRADFRVQPRRGDDLVCSFTTFTGNGFTRG